MNIVTLHEAKQSVAHSGPAIIVTLHEAEQSAEVCKPLWPIYSTFPHCSGPCGQGRSLCMTPEACQTGQADDDGWEPLLMRDNLMFWTPILLIIGGLVAFVLYANGVRL